MKTVGFSISHNASSYFMDEQPSVFYARGVGGSMQESRSNNKFSIFKYLLAECLKTANAAEGKALLVSCKCLTNFLQE